MPEPLPLPVPLADPFAGMGQYEFASFCPDCLGTTTPVSTGTLHPGGYFGFGLLEERRSWCERCGSRVGRVWFCLLLLPVLPLARYRIIYVWGGGEGEIHFLARQLRETDQRERIKGKVFWACFLLGLIGGALVLGVERTFLGGLVGYALFMLWFLKRPK